MLAARTRATRRGREPKVYGVGAAKTGTHSLASTFRSVCVAEHEADAVPLIRHVLDRERGAGDRQLRRYLRRRDLDRPIKIDASQVNLYLIDDLERVFPGSRYVMTVRHPVHWLRSIIDDTMRRGTGRLWHEFRDLRFGAKADPDRREERALAERDLYTLDGYLGYWRRSVVEPPRRIPAGRLLTVRTDHLADRVADIADFAGVPVPEVTSEETHAFANPERFGVLDEIPVEYLTDRLEERCGDLVEQHFPEQPIAAALAEVVGSG